MAVQVPVEGELRREAVVTRPAVERHHVVSVPVGRSTRRPGRRVPRMPIEIDRPMIVATRVIAAVPIVDPTAVAVAGSMPIHLRSAAALVVIGGGDRRDCEQHGQQSHP